MPPHVLLARFAGRDFFWLINSVGNKEKLSEYTIAKPITAKVNEITERLNQTHIWSCDFTLVISFCS